MIGKLEFNLPEEKEEFNFAVNGSKIAYGIQEFDQELRKMNKYEEHSQEIHDLVDKLRTKLRECVDVPEVW